MKRVRQHQQTFVKEFAVLGDLMPGHPLTRTDSAPMNTILIQALVILALLTECHTSVPTLQHW